MQRELFCFYKSIKIRPSFQLLVSYILLTFRKKTLNKIKKILIVRACLLVCFYVFILNLITT